MSLRVLTGFNPIGLSLRDAAVLLPSHVVRNIGTGLHNGTDGPGFITCNPFMDIFEYYLLL